jgi:hypothetical protein
VELVIAKEERKSYYLQHQEEEEVKMPSDEEKNVTHRYVVYFGVLVLDNLSWTTNLVPAGALYRMTKG